MKKFFLTALVMGTACAAFAGTNVAVNLGGLGVSVGSGHHGTNIGVRVGGPCYYMPPPPVMPPPAPVLVSPRPVVVVQPPVVIHQPVVIEQTPVYYPPIYPVVVQPPRYRDSYYEYRPGHVPNRPGTRPGYAPGHPGKPHGRH